MKTFNDAIENVAARFARDCYELTPFAARTRVRPVLATVAFIYDIDINVVVGNFECAVMDFNSHILDACAENIFED